MNDNLEVRLFVESDTDSVWQIIEEVIAGGESYVFSPDSSREKMLAYWLSPEKKIYVAILDDKVVATFVIKPNMPDRKRNWRGHWKVFTDRGKKTRLPGHAIQHCNQVE